MSSVLPDATIGVAEAVNKYLAYALEIHDTEPTEDEIQLVRAWRHNLRRKLTDAKSNPERPARAGKACETDGAKG